MNKNFNRAADAHEAAAAQVEQAPKPALSVSMFYEHKGNLTVLPIDFMEIPKPAQLIGKIGATLYKLHLSTGKKALEFRLKFSKPYYGRNAVDMKATKLESVRAMNAGLMETFTKAWGNESTFDDSIDAADAGGVNEFQDNLMQRIGAPKLEGQTTDLKVEAIKGLAKAVADANKYGKALVREYVDNVRIASGLPTIEQQKQITAAEREAKKQLQLAAAAPAENAEG